MAIILTSEIRNHWLWKEPERFQWWLDLLLLSADEDCVETHRGQNYECRKGQVVATLSMLAERWKTTRSIVRRFLEKLVREGLIRHSCGTNLAQITICDTDNKDASWHRVGTIEAQQIESGTNLAQITICDTDNKDASWHRVGTEKDATKEEKEEKEKKEPKKRNNKKNNKNLLLLACAREGLEEKKSEPTLVSKARKIFESVYLELYGSPYYWSAKDATNMQQLLKKISFSRTNRASPLPADDDSVLSALDQFLRSINKDWISNNFSVPKINSYYNDIISEIKNTKSKNNGKPANNTRQLGNADVLSSVRQKQNLIFDLSKVEDEWREEKRVGAENLE